MTSNAPDIPRTVSQKDPEDLPALLDDLRTQEEFWSLIAARVCESHLTRRQAYYRARFARERIDAKHQLFWLTAEFYSDALCQTDELRAYSGVPPIKNRRIASLVALDEALATITTLKDWPHSLLPLLPDWSCIYDLVGMGIMPPEEGLDKMKDYTRSHMSATYDLPVLPLT